MTDAKEYGKALFLLTEEEGTTEAVLSDIRVVKDVMLQNPSYEKLLDTPALPKSEKIALLDQAFHAVDEMLLNFLKLLCENRAVYLFPKAADEYFKLYDESRGIERVEAITAVSMTNAQKEALSKKLSSLTGKQIVLKNTVDKSILGGMKLRYAGIQVDGSIQKRLDNFEQSLKNMII